MDSGIIANQMITLFLVIAIGYVLRKLRMIDDAFAGALNRFVLDVTMPFLILSSVLENGATAELPLDSMVASCMILTVLLPLLALVLVYVLPIRFFSAGDVHNSRALWAFMIMYPNVGFMGFPLIQSIFGPDALLETAVINMCFNFSLFTLGHAVMGFGKPKTGMPKQNTATGVNTCDSLLRHSTKDRLQQFLKKLISPGIAASLAAIFCYAAKISCPKTLLSPMEMVGSLTTPLAMLLIGVSLARIPFTSIWNDWRVYIFALLIQFIIPTALWPVIAFTIPDTLLRGITLIILAMPAANSAVLFAAQYDKDDAFAAKSIFLSTFISIVTIPLLVRWFLL